MSDRSIVLRRDRHLKWRAFDALEAVMRAEPVDFVQLNYAMDDRAAEARLLPLAAARGNLDAAQTRASLAQRMSQAEVDTATRIAETLLVQETPLAESA